MTYPEEFQTTLDEDGDYIRLSERGVGTELRLRTTSDLAYVKREDVPDMIEWLQAYYDATEPVLPTTAGSRIKVTYTSNTITTTYDEVILISDDALGKVWRVIKQDGKYGFLGFFKYDNWENLPEYTWELLFDAGADN